MTGPEFRAALARLALSQRGASRFYGVALSTVQEWLADGPSPPAARLTRIMLALGMTAADTDRVIAGEQRHVGLAPPPPGTTDEDDRDEAAYDALAPATRAVLAAAVAVGWSPPEAEVAMVAALADAMVESAGGDRVAAVEVLLQAVRALKAET